MKPTVESSISHRRTRTNKTKRNNYVLGPGKFCGAITGKCRVFPEDEDKED